jgi:hypothetical protein
MCLLFKHRKMHQVHMEVQDIKLRGPSFDLVQHGQVCGKIGFQRCNIEADRLISYRDKTRFRARIGGGEQGDLVPQLHQGIAEVRDGPFRAAIQLRRHSFIQRSNLRDSHVSACRWTSVECRMMGFRLSRQQHDTSIETDCAYIRGPGLLRDPTATSLGVTTPLDS